MVVKILYSRITMLLYRNIFFEECLPEHSSLRNFQRFYSIQAVNVCYRNVCLHLDTLLPHLQYAELECFTDGFNELSVGSNGGRKLGAGAFGSVSILYWLGVCVCVCVCARAHVCIYICKYRVSHELRSLLQESVPYVKVYRYNPKHLYPKLNGYVR